ncbi:uncharacterized protein TRIREDRAFT_110343 [Trichoderma reesei QM6a]|uniref:Predicted protein n=2 Tax=Hypocrea jecorina TaxID=51453 RepID=G0RRT2_HYPJQ|nr:uncharacterized protein TRIREDRAFT_110343 [Trichoderma reesei QM6a]EGR45950.1 predicted protein [Trichoderma reesei QM6a]ETR99203.1 hypothetical protein M419DRAFT_132923 [Trichoderma reesei RUT C-30]
MVIGRLRNNAASNTTGSPIITRNVREEKVGVKLQVRKWTEDDSGSLANSGLDGFGPFSHVVPLRLLCRLSFGDAVSPNAVESTTHVCNGVQATSVNLHDLYLSIPLTHHMIAGGCLTTFVSGIVFLETSRISADSAGLGVISTEMLSAVLSRAGDYRYKSKSGLTQSKSQVKNIDSNGSSHGNHDCAMALSLSLVLGQI